MSNATIRSMIILIALVIGAFAFAGLTYVEKLQLQKDKKSLELQIEDYRSREQSSLNEKKQLEDKLKAAEAAKAELQAKLSGVDTNVQGLNDKVKSLSSESDQLKKQIEALKTERDQLSKDREQLAKEREELTVKLTEAPKEKVVYVEKKPGENAAGASQPDAASTSGSASVTRRDEGDSGSALEAGSFCSHAG